MIRRSNINAGTFAVLILVGLPILVFTKVSDSLGVVTTILASAAVLLSIFLFVRHGRAVKMAKLVQKYGDTSIAERIMRHCYWQGQTREQLWDSLGPPVAVDDMPMKTRKREVWKYNRQGKNRYGLRITLDNDEVATWERKN